MRRIKRILLYALACSILLTGNIGIKKYGIAESGETMGAVQTETVQTDSFSIDFFRFGHGDKVFVILPGLSVESVMKYADAVAQAYSLLTDGFTVYVFDRRKEMPEDYSMLDMARDTAEAFRVLGLKDICLFGASQGGAIAMIIAVREPELVEKLVLGSTFARITPELYENVDSWIRLAESGKAEKLYLAFGEAIYPPEVFRQARENLAAAAGNVTEEEMSRFVIQAESIKGFDITESISRIACPVLVLGSKDDRVLGAESPELIAKQLRTYSELYIYDGYGHAAYDLAPDYKERILRFLLQDPSVSGGL